ncbi:MAG: hypothetical protein KF894_00330 [Labilithrix sp.]|nr:hypothetical protein [Labilithrix sp.]
MIWWFFFDEREAELVAHVLELLGPKARAEAEGMLARLEGLAVWMRNAPSMSASWDVETERAFSEESLLAQLCEVDDYDLDLHVPTKAVVGQAHLIAKINFFRALGYMVAAERLPPAFGERVEREVAQSVYTKLAEELFVTIVTDRRATRDVKMGAARFLYQIWEHRLRIEIDDFAPLLESAWAARSKLVPVLGTMLGTHELFRLFQEARDKRFLDYFGEDEISPEQGFAFEEFLFGLSHEEIGRIRATMTAEGKAVISLDEARALLGHAPPSSGEPGGALALYASYKRRRVNAMHRALTGAEGPKKTAEEYVMIAYVAGGARPSNVR